MDGKRGGKGPPVEMWPGAPSNIKTALRREAAIAGGKKPLAARGSGERRKLPRRVWGVAPETVRIVNISCQKSTFWDLLNLVFVNN